MANKRIRKKIAKKAAQAARLEAEIFTEAANPIVDLEREWKQEARNTAEDARVLAQADSDIYNGVNGKPFHPDKDQELLFDEINAAVEAANDLDNGTDEANRHHLKHLEERDNPDEWNPETVIDEKIKEEQKAQEEQELRNELVNDLA